MHGNLSRRSLFFVAVISAPAALGGCTSQTPEWAFRDAGGDIKTIAEYDQGLKVLCFTNTWCDPCREALTAMQELNDQFADRGVRVVFVSSWEQGDPASFMEEQGYTFGLILNGTSVAQDHNVNQLPTFCIVGVDGKVVSRFEGYDSGTTNKVVKAVDKYLRRYQGRTGAPVAGTTDDD
jgi:thiol-disulfide isomerase/thioredoxin